MKLPQSPVKPSNEVSRTQSDVRHCFMLSGEDSIILDEFWKNETYPDPGNPNRQLRFQSKKEFLNYVARCVINSRGLMWYLISNGLNPNFPRG